MSETRPARTGYREPRIPTPTPLAQTPLDSPPSHLVTSTVTCSSACPHVQLVSRAQSTLAARRFATLAKVSLRPRRAEWPTTRWVGEHGHRAREQMLARSTGEGRRARCCRSGAQNNTCEGVALGPAPTPAHTTRAPCASSVPERADTTSFPSFHSVELWRRSSRNRWLRRASLDGRDERTDACARIPAGLSEGRWELTHGAYRVRRRDPGRLEPSMTDFYRSSPRTTPQIGRAHV